MRIFPSSMKTVFVAITLGSFLSVGAARAADASNEPEPDSGRFFSSVHANDGCGITITSWAGPTWGFGTPTMTEITVRVVGWSLAVAGTVPTIAVTVLGGAWVQLRQRQTLAQVKSRRSAA